MRLSDLLKETYSAITIKKGRTFLTILGIIIGISSVTAILTIGEAAQQSIEKDIKSFGDNIIFIDLNSSNISESGKNIDGITKNNINEIKKIDGVDSNSIFSFDMSTYIVGYKNKDAVFPIMGGEYGSLDKVGFEIENGRFFNKQHESSASKVVFIGPEVKDELFPNKNPVGENIKINDITFQIIGVMKSKKMTTQSFDNSIFMPLSTLQKYLTGRNSAYEVWVYYNKNFDVVEIKEEIKQSLLKSSGLEDDGIEYFMIMTQDDTLELTNNITGIFSSLLAAIAAISLLVSGIGIMNMMLRIVAERTKEIGLRKAIGATTFEISVQFLTESIALTILGGFFGVLFGILLSNAIIPLMNLQRVISLNAIIVSFSVSGSIGILFGFYPARRAAKMNPIDALRIE